MPWLLEITIMTLARIPKFKEKWYALHKPWRNISMCCLSFRGAWLIAVLVIGLSGLWPFVKLGMLLYVWLTPPASLKKSKRGRILLFLDEYGKYSFSTWACWKGMGLKGDQWWLLLPSKTPASQHFQLCFYAFLGQWVFSRFSQQVHLNR